MSSSRVDLLQVAATEVHLQAIDLHSGREVGGTFRSIFTHSIALLTQMLCRPGDSGSLAPQALSDYRRALSGSGSPASGWRFFAEDEGDYGPDSDTTALVLIAAARSKALLPGELQEAADALAASTTDTGYHVWLRTTRLPQYRVGAVDPVVTFNVASALIEAGRNASAVQHRLSAARKLIDAGLHGGEVGKISTYYRSAQFVRLLMAVHAHDAPGASSCASFGEREMLFCHGHRPIGYCLRVGS